MPFDDDDKEDLGSGKDGAGMSAGSKAEVRQARGLYLLRSLTLNQARVPVHKHIT